MPGSALPALRVAALAGLLLTAGASAPLAQERVGVNSAVNPQATGIPPNGAARRLVIGQEVVFNEHITTAEGGQTQLLFLDESSMTVGPNSDLTIDQFVYDPKSGTGKLAMSATRGLLRYVGGKLSKQDRAVTLRTSTATLAVRGGAFIADIKPNGSTEAVFIYGKGLTVTGLCSNPPMPCGVGQTLIRPGFQVTVSTPGAAPSPPAAVPAGQLAQLIAQLDGRTGGTGGATNIPTNATVADSGLSQTISGNVILSVQQSVQNQGITTTASSTTTTNAGSIQTATNSQPNSAGQVIDCVSTGTCPTTTMQVGTTPSGGSVGGPNSITGPAPPTVTVTLPPPTPPPPPQVTISYASGSLSFPMGAPQQGVFTASAGKLDMISFPLVPGSARFGPQGTSSSFGTFSGTSVLSPDKSSFYATIMPTSPLQRPFFIYVGTHFTTGQPLAR